MSPSGRRVVAKMARGIRAVCLASAEMSECDWEEFQALLADSPVTFRDLEALKSMLSRISAAPKEAGK